MWKLGVMQSKHTSVIILFCTFCYWCNYIFTVYYIFQNWGGLETLYCRVNVKLPSTIMLYIYFILSKHFCSPTPEISPSGRTIFASFLGYSRRRMGLQPNAFIFSTWKNRENFKNNNKLCQRYMETQAPQQYVSIATQRHTFTYRRADVGATFLT